MLTRVLTHSLHKVLVLLQESLQHWVFSWYGVLDGCCRGTLRVGVQQPGTGALCGFHCNRLPQFGQLVRL